jgi:PPOX class probable F420-dependent enzyme
MNEHQEAALRRKIWFGSYTRSGELKKVQVWCNVRDGMIEFLTAGDSYKAKRIRKNPQVLCNLGWETGPSVEGTAEIVSNAADVARGYRSYWKTHPVMMIFVFWPIRRAIRGGNQIMVRVKPNEPNPLAGFTDRALS